MSNLVLHKPNQLPRYAHIPLDVIEDSRLSATAQWLHTYLISRPPGWEVRLEDLERRTRDGLARLKGAIRELQQYGYLRITQMRGGDARFSGRLWEVAYSPNAFNRQTIHREAENALSVSGRSETAPLSIKQEAITKEQKTETANKKKPGAGAPEFDAAFSDLLGGEEQGQEGVPSRLVRKCTLRPQTQEAPAMMDDCSEPEPDALTDDLGQDGLAVAAAEPEKEKDADPSPVPAPPPQADEDPEVQARKKGARDALELFGVKPGVAKKLVDNHPLEVVEKQIAWFPQHGKKGPGFLIRAIEGDYDPPAPIKKQMTVEQEMQRRADEACGRIVYDQFIQQAMSIGFVVDHEGRRLRVVSAPQNAGLLLDGGSGWFGVPVDVAMQRFSLMEACA